MNPAKTIQGRIMARTHRRVLAALIAALALVMATAWPASAVRLKDIATFSGLRTNDLVGYGLVVGLGGTGDGTSSQFTIQSMANMLENMGVRVSASAMKPKNVAAVMVTAKMPVSARPGSRIDVTCSSIGDAKSLLGGTLLLTPMKGIDGRVYAIAQGPMTIGGFAVAGEAASVQENIATVGIIPNGAVIERGVPFRFNQQSKMTVSMSIADFSTAVQVAKKINATVGGDYARAVDAATIELMVPDKFQGNVVPLMASLENLEVSPDGRARVVVDEKTGTVVLGQNVRLTKVAVSHGNLQIVITETDEVSQPQPFGQGQTVTTPVTDIGVREENNRLILMEGATLQELVDGLNSIGATPRDLISILRTLQASGALLADLEVI